MRRRRSAGGRAHPRRRSQPAAYTTAVVPTRCTRLDRLRVLITRLTSFPCIGEVLMVTSGKCTADIEAALKGASRWNDVKVRIADMGQWDDLFGPAVRFLAGSQAHRNVLLHLDDDELPCAEQACSLTHEVLNEPIGIFGHHPRVCNSHVGYTALKISPRVGQHVQRSSYNVVLTSFAATSKAFNDAFVSHLGDYGRALANARGNGEDLAYNHFLLHKFNRTPSYVPWRECAEWVVNGSDVYQHHHLPHSKFAFNPSAKLDDQSGISLGVHHYWLRKRLCTWAWHLRDWRKVNIIVPELTGTS